MNPMQVSTMFGTMSLHMNNGHTIRFKADEGFKINGVLYSLHGQFQSNGSEWKITGHMILQKTESNKYNDYSTAAWNKVTPVISEVMEKWVQNNPEIIHDACIAENEENKINLREKMAIAQKELDDMHIQLATLENLYT